MISLPESWSDWILTAVIGEGAFATVYEANRKDDSSIRAAIKVISIPQDASEVQELFSQGFDLEQIQKYFNETVAEFIREVKVMEFFKGTQNIVSIEDYKVEPKEDGIGSYIFIRMELLTSLDDYISDKQLTEQEVARIGIDLCSALNLCISKNVIHRDIKPENIFVNDKIGTNVFYKLGDFGIARSLEHRTAGMSSKGTPNYIAPEVVLGKSYDSRADIYSLGLTLYRLLNNNRLPFFPQTPLYTPAAKREALMRRMNGETLEPPLNASPAMGEIILKACAYCPEDRFQSAEEMRQALLVFVAGKNTPVITKSTVTVNPPSQPIAPSGSVQSTEDTVQLSTAPVRALEESKPTEKTNRRLPRLLIALSAIVIVLMLGFGGQMLFRQLKDDMLHELSLLPTSIPAPTDTVAPVPTPQPTHTLTPTAAPLSKPTTTPSSKPTATPRPTTTPSP
ncbi:MAG: serine/threonine protein kinase, partial [Acidaminococcaceae bacterium]|nr:serine/threonine protein kinase [Acidaminococcaceae bacterium]